MTAAEKNRENIKKISKKSCNYYEDFNLIIYHFQALVRKSDILLQFVCS